MPPAAPRAQPAHAPAAQAPAASPAEDGQAQAGTAPAQHPAELEATPALAGVRFSQLGGALQASMDELGAVQHARLAASATTTATATPAPLAEPSAAPASPVEPEQPVQPVDPAEPVEPVEIDHATPHDGNAGEHQARQERGQISAGPRPRLPLQGQADPLAATRHQESAQHEMGAHLAAAQAATDMDLPLAQLSLEAAYQPQPALPAMELTPPPLPELPDPAASLPAGALPALDAAIAPALDARMTEISADITARQAEADAEAGRVDRDFDERLARQAAQAHTQQERIIADSEASIQGARQAWRADNQAVQLEWSQRAHAEQSAAEAEIQASVAEGETQADAVLTEAETRSQATQAEADARAQAIVAGAQSRAAACRTAASSPDEVVQRQELPGFEEGGGGAQTGEAEEIMAEAQAEVERELARAQQEIQRLLDNAQGLTEEQIEHRVLLIASRIEQLRHRIRTQVDEALGDRFPTLETYYLGEIDRLLRDAKSQIYTVGGALMDGDADLAQERMTTLNDVFARRTEQLDAVLEDVESLSHFQTVDEALEAFGITVDVTDGDTEDDEAAPSVDTIWTQDRKENALGAAIRMENAFRAADTGGLLDQYDDPGAAFSAIMGGVELDYVHLVGDDRKDGAWADSESHIEFYTFSNNETFPNNEMYHFAHEFGHVFNMNALGAHPDQPKGQPYRDLMNEEITAPVDFERTGSEGAWHYEFDLFGQTLTFDTWNGADRRITVPRDDRTYILDVSGDEATVVVGGGSESSRHITENFGMPCANPDGSLTGCFPHQQNPTQTPHDGEEYADMHANWSYNSFTENPAGDARDEWMEGHMPEWMALALEHNSESGS